jgi:hypothetical protein
VYCIDDYEDDNSKKYSGCKLHESSCLFSLQPCPFFPLAIGNDLRQTKHSAMPQVPAPYLFQDCAVILPSLFAHLNNPHGVRVKGPAKG